MLYRPLVKGTERVSLAISPAPSFSIHVRSLVLVPSYALVPARALDPPRGGGAQMS
jgi:hypothetical protein